MRFLLSSSPHSSLPYQWPSCFLVLRCAFSSSPGCELPQGKSSSLPHPPPATLTFKVVQGWKATELPPHRETFLPQAPFFPPSFNSSVAISYSDQFVSGNMKYPHHMITSNQGQPRNFPQAEHITLWLLFTSKFGKLARWGWFVFLTYMST